MKQIDSPITILILCLLFSIITTHAEESVSTELQTEAIQEIQQQAIQMTERILEQVPDLSQEQEQATKLETTKMITEQMLARSKMMKAREQNLEREAMRGLREEMMAARKEHMNVIKSILTEEQFEAFNTAIESQMPQRGGREGGRDKRNGGDWGSGKKTSED